QASCRPDRIRCLDDRNHQTFGQGEGLSGSPSPMGRRTHLRMAWPMPPPCQRLGDHHRILHGIGDDSLYPHAYPEPQGIATFEKLRSQALRPTAAIRPSRRLGGTLKKSRPQGPAWKVFRRGCLKGTAHMSVAARFRKCKECNQYCSIWLQFMKLTRSPLVRRFADQPSTYLQKLAQSSRPGLFRSCERDSHALPWHPRSPNSGLAG
ncbi:hypothetical protein EDF58_1201, partial [Novosphingobium sp. PhB57]